VSGRAGPSPEFYYDAGYSVLICKYHGPAVVGLNGHLKNARKERQPIPGQHGRAVLGSRARSPSQAKAQRYCVRADIIWNLTDESLQVFGSICSWWHDFLGWTAASRLIKPQSALAKATINRFSAAVKNWAASSSPENGWWKTLRSS
jgi:hypothetical protein